MKLVSLVLHNYRKFKHSTILFPDGVIGLLGPNGAGKSTILEAIGWVIYGNKAARTTKELIMREGISSKDDCWVQIQFEIGDNRYEILRKFSGKTQVSEAEVKVNGTVMASSSSEVTRYLEKSLGMDHDSFFTSLIAKQKELNALSVKTPGERKKIVMRMLNIDAVDEIIRRVRDDRRDRENRIRGIETGLKNIDDIKDSIRLVTEKQGLLERDLKDLDENLQKLRQKTLELQRIRDEQQKGYETYARLEKELSLFTERYQQKKQYLSEKKKQEDEIVGKQDRLTELEPQLHRYEKIIAQKKNLEEQREKYLQKEKIQGDISSLLSEIRDIQDTITALKNKRDKIKETREERKKIGLKKEKIEQKKTETEKIAHEKKTYLESLEKHIQNMEKEKEGIEALGPQSSCPTCKRPLGDHYSLLLKEYSHKIDSDRKESESLQKELNQVMTHLDLYAKELRDVNQMEKQRHDQEIEEIKINQDLKNYLGQETKAQEKIKALKASLTKFGDIRFDRTLYTQICEKEEHFSKAKDNALVLQNEIKKLPVIKQDIHQLQQDITIAQNKQETLKKQIEDLDFNKEKFDMVNKRYEERRAQLNDKEKKQVALASNLKQYVSEKQRYLQELEDQQKQRTHIQAIKHEIMNLEILAGDREKGLLNDFKRYLISRISPLLSQFASELFTIFTNGKYTTIDIDENYEIYIYDHGERFPITRFSGGEEDLANLCLRLAISQVVAQRAGNIEFQFLALDEIFGSQDSERKINVLRALHELSHQFRQILLITHIDDVKDSMEHIIQVQERTDGTSYVEMT